MSEESRYLSTLRRALAGLLIPLGYHDVKVLRDSWRIPEVRLPPLSGESR
jgi:hypothetical protein